MSNQNNPYPDVTNQPLLNNQQGYGIPQNQGYIPPQGNQGYIPSITHFIQTITTDHHPLPNPTLITKDITREDKALFQIKEAKASFQEEDFCVPSVGGRLIISQERSLEESLGFGVLGCLSSLESAAAFPSVWIAAKTQSWSAWCASA